MALKECSSINGQIKRGGTTTTTITYCYAEELDCIFRDDLQQGNLANIIIFDIKAQYDVRGIICHRYT